MTDRIRFALLFLVVLTSITARVSGAFGSVIVDDHRRHLSHAATVAHERATVVRYARRYIGVPYSYGGTSPRSGFDCSGFTRFVYAHFGIALPHYSGAQFGMGRRVARAALRPGDLLFFDGLGHVGLYVGRRAVHPRAAHRHARLDRVDQRLVRRALRRRPPPSPLDPA